MAQPKLEKIEIRPSNIENIDAAMLDWLDNKLNIYTTTNKGWKKVPINWVLPERAYQIKNKPGLRDQNETLILPLISLERTGLVKELTKKGSFYGNVPAEKGFDPRGGSIEISRVVAQETSNKFATAEISGGRIFYRQHNPKMVYETISIPMPVYIELNYLLTAKTDYQQQMNEVVAPLISYTGGINSFLLRRNGHAYEAFIQSDFASKNTQSSLDIEDRHFKTELNIKVLGYIIGADTNEEKPFIVRRETIAEIKLPRERTMVGDIPDLSGERKYRT